MKAAEPPMSGSTDWSAPRLGKLLATISDVDDEVAAASLALEHAAEALGTDAGAVVVDGKVQASIGLLSGPGPAGDLAPLIEEGADHVSLRGIGRCSALVVPIETERAGHMVLARSGREFDDGERALVEDTARVLALTLKMLSVLERERERHRLLTNLLTIQSSISHGSPLQEVLDAINEGLTKLLGVEVAGVRLIDPDDPSQVVLASVSGLAPELVERIRRGPVQEGAGGRAVLENRLVIIDDYETSGDALPPLAQDRLQTAMAAPVHEHGEVVGSLTVATYRRGRHFTPSEQEALLAFAQHASLALSDARNVEAMREAERAKELFLTMVSHELKTPLTVIMGTLRTLQTHGKELRDDLRDELIASAFERGEDLRRLIDRLLQAGRAELAGVQEETTLPEVIARATRGFDQARRLSVHPVPGADVKVDAAAVNEVVGVFLENALAHSPADASIEVEAGVSDGHARVAIRNPGSLPEELERLFLPFQRGSGTTASGVGLGLYIASRLAAALGGRIEVSSSGGMVEFALVFPLRPERAALVLAGTMKRRSTGAPGARGTR